jgi:hypothetical protein
VHNTRATTTNELANSTVTSHGAGHLSNHKIRRTNQGTSTLVASDRKEAAVGRGACRLIGAGFRVPREQFDLPVRAR